MQTFNFKHFCAVATLAVASFILPSCTLLNDPDNPTGPIISSRDPRYLVTEDLQDPAKRHEIAKSAWKKLDDLFAKDYNIRTTPLGQLPIRDICILPCEDGLYYMTCSGGVSRKDGKRERGFVTYASEDLENWTGPYPAFMPKADFWKINDFWAPELHMWKGNYYLFGTTGSSEHRGTQIFKSTSGNAAGPYEPVAARPVTPEEWMALDGSLYVDPAGKPWIVFCHEWVQITDGTVCAAPLSDDLTKLIGKPITLFKSSDAPWSRPDPGENNYVTDGCYVYREDGKLKMLWSAFNLGSYQLAVAESESGKLEGPWKHVQPLVYTKDGGHGMHFITFEGKHKIILHAPNRGSRAVLLDCKHI